MASQVISPVPKVYLVALPEFYYRWMSVFDFIAKLDWQTLIVPGARRLRANVTIAPLTSARSPSQAKHAHLTV